MACSSMEGFPDECAVLESASAAVWEDSGMKPLHFSRTLLSFWFRFLGSSPPPSSNAHSNYLWFLPCSWFYAVRCCLTNPYMRSTSPRCWWATSHRWGSTGRGLQQISRVTLLRNHDRINGRQEVSQIWHCAAISHVAFHGILSWQYFSILCGRISEQVLHTQML